MEINIAKAILLIIDVQNDFCPGGAMAVADGDAVMAPLNALSGAFAENGGRVAATQDWHCKEHISFASSHKDKNTGDVIETSHVKKQVLWPNHCIRGTKGADFRPSLDIKPVSIIIRKGINKDIDSYSAFFENDRKTTTGLKGIIRSLGIDTVVIGGIATDYCVFYTAMDSKKLRFKTIVIEDAVRGVGYPEGSIEAAVSKMKEAGIEFTSSKNLLENIG